MAVANKVDNRVLSCDHEYVKEQLRFWAARFGSARLAAEWIRKIKREHGQPVYFIFAYRNNNKRWYTDNYERAVKWLSFPNKKEPDPDDYR